MRRQEIDLFFKILDEYKEKMFNGGCSDYDLENTASNAAVLLDAVKWNTSDPDQLLEGISEVVDQARSKKETLSTQDYFVFEYLLSQLQKHFNYTPEEKSK